jgi:hypothetical protein
MKSENELSYVSVLSLEVQNGLFSILLMFKYILIEVIIFQIKNENNRSYLYLTVWIYFENMFYPNLECLSAHLIF